MDILLLVDGPGAEAFSENEQLLSLISNTLKKQDAVLACIGSTALLPLLASEEPLKQKITMPRELSGRGVTLGANYTGNAVESEDKLVTTTGADRDVIRQFLRAVANKR